MSDEKIINEDGEEIDEEIMADEMTSGEHLVHIQTVAGVRCRSKHSFRYPATLLGEGTSFLSSCDECVAEIHREFNPSQTSSVWTARRRPALPPNEIRRILSEKP